MATYYKKYATIEEANQDYSEGKNAYPSVCYIEETDQIYCLRKGIIGGEVIAWYSAQLDKFIYTEKEETERYLGELKRIADWEDERADAYNDGEVHNLHVYSDKYLTEEIIGKEPEFCVYYLQGNDSFLIPQQTMLTLIINGKNCDSYVYQGYVDWFQESFANIPLEFYNEGEDITGYCKLGDFVSGFTESCKIFHEQSNYGDTGDFSINVYSDDTFNNLLDSGYISASYIFPLFNGEEIVKFIKGRSLIQNENGNYTSNNILIKGNRWEETPYYHLYLPNYETRLHLTQSGFDTLCNIFENERES